ncbi:carbonic anhydrase [Nodosilinea nodulosa]|uniref:carbonic anhydrase n=1 Tax=Nodosilinea nodulosa TaxID=416001 RepID=UPI000474D61D|nr:carbonic anhydrase family protein [Nodosilinea nodulosa]
MDRRRALRVLGLGGASAVALGSSSLLRAVASEGDRSWGYVGDDGPAAWGELAPEFKVCSLGQEQSPIDLHDPIRADLSAITFNYQPVPLRLINTGHTIQINVDAGNTIVLDDQTYTLRQFHFHHPSEHTVDGAAFPMELHLVHSNDNGELAVVGIFLTEGSENLTLAPVWRAMPTQKSEEIAVPNVQIDLDALLPRHCATFRYFGSLTTPPCSETVAWSVLQTPLEISTAQVDQFKAVFPLNARPVQAQHRRILLESR